MKTPEEMAEEKCAERLYEMPQQFAKSLEYCVKKQMKSCYFAGYKAANERALRLVDEVQERLSGAYDNGEFMESEWDYIVMAFDTISTAIRGLK